MMPVRVSRAGVLAYKPVLAKVISLLHCTEGNFRDFPNPVNVVPNSISYVGYGTDLYRTYFGEDPLGEGYTDGNDPGVIHSTTKVQFTGQFCIEGYFFPTPLGDTLMEIADGNAWDQTGPSYISFNSFAVNEDDNYIYVQTQIRGRIVGGSPVDFGNSMTWTVDKNATVKKAHVALMRDINNYVIVTYRGQEVARTSTPFPGLIDGYINYMGGYDQNTGVIKKGGHQIIFNELRATKGSSVYTTLPFTPTNNVFPNP